MAEYETYLSSLEVFDKVSNIDTKDLVSLLTKTSTSENISQEELSKIIKSTQSFSRKELTDTYNLMLDAMIVNNKVANKSISIPEQKVITQSNFSTEIPSSVISRTELYSVRQIIENLPKATPLSLDYSTIRDIIHNSNVEITEVETIDALQDFQKTGFTTLQTKGLLMTKNGRVDGHDDLASEFLKERMEDKSSLVGDYVLHQAGITKKVNFKSVFSYTNGGLSYKDIGTTTVSYLGKISNTKNGDKIKRVFGSAGGKLENGNITAIQSSIEKKLNATSIKNKALELSATESAHQKNKDRTRNNIFIDDMLKAGPNIYTNMFDIYFRFNSIPSHDSLIIDTKKSSDSSSSKDVTKPSVSYIYFMPLTKVNTKGEGNTTDSATLVERSTFEDVYSLSVRTANVTIPLRNRESTAFKFLNTEVERPSPMVTQNLEGTISIDCDANAYVYDMFLALAGLQRNGQFRNKDNKLEYINNDLYDRSKNNYPFMAPAKLGYQMNTVDLVVSSHSLSMWSDKGINPTYGGYYSNMVFVFKDVRFLGVGSGLQFNTENSGLQTCDVNFIAKDLETYFKPDNMEFAAYNKNIVRSSLFTAKNVYGEYYDESSVSEKTKPSKTDIGMEESK